MVCQTSITSPISAAYNCPSCDNSGLMGSNSSFTVMWPVGITTAYKIATAGLVQVYLSPKYADSVNQQDFPQEQYELTPLCSGQYFGYCDGAPDYVNPDFNCYLSCKTPQTIATTGWYTIQWVWDWAAERQIYTACADVYVYNGPVPTRGPTPPTTSTGGSDHSSGPSTGGPTLPPPNPSPSTGPFPTPPTPSITTGHNIFTSSGKPTPTNNQVSSNQNAIEKLWILWVIMAPIILGLCAFIVVASCKLMKRSKSRSGYETLEENPNQNQYENENQHHQTQPTKQKNNQVIKTRK